MNLKEQKSSEDMEATGRMVDLRYVMVDEQTNLEIDQYVLDQRKCNRILKKGQGAVDLIIKGLKAEGIRK